NLEDLFKGNHEFRDYIAKSNPGLLETLAKEGQRPPFMMLDCSDSRVSEQAIFNAKPGTIFTTGNIANQFLEEDLTSNSVLAYAVDQLKVKHVVVMGHYGCGGVAASMVPPPNEPLTPGDSAVQAWILPIRRIFERSTRPEIVAYREKQRGNDTFELPHYRDPGFRALVEENVKKTVSRVVNSAVIRRHYKVLTANTGTDKPPVNAVFIHGWVYDVENGVVSDLDVSVGPPGITVPKSPFPAASGSPVKFETARAARIAATG
ncbi:hypothetical protein AX17_003942, partial [Amanita inopinata Kibby_2008]